MALVNDAGLGAITEGCKTSHGGIVLPISRPFTDFIGGESRSIAVVGDMTHCPKCRGDFPIAEGDGTRTWHDKPMAFHGHKTACGAILISEIAPPPLVELINAVRNGTAHDEQFQLKDDEGNPLPNCDYTIKASDGQIFRGTTDEQGYSVRVFTTKAESLAIHLGDVE